MVTERLREERATPPMSGDELRFPVGVAGTTRMAVVAAILAGIAVMAYAGWLKGAGGVTGNTVAVAIVALVLGAAAWKRGRFRPSDVILGATTLTVPSANAILWGGAPTREVALSSVRDLVHISGRRGGTFVELADGTRIPLFGDYTFRLLTPQDHGRLTTALSQRLAGSRGVVR